MNELSVLVPHFLKDGRGKLEVYFTRVYNPVWTNPEGLTGSKCSANEEIIGLHVALTPTWSETAYFADYILPMGVGSERHDIHSYETHDAQWLVFVSRYSGRPVNDGANKSRYPSSKSGRGVGRE